MSQRNFVRHSLALFLLLLAPVAAFAQSSNGSIAGDAADNTGGALPGVSVTATNVATNVSRTVVSNSSGHYEIPLLRPGVYNISAELAGFQAVSGRVSVNVGTTTTFDVKM
jgi:hypothetical protein